MGGSAFPGGGRARGTAPFVAVVIVLSLVGILPSGISHLSLSTSHPLPGATLLASGPCGGALAATSFSGSLAVQGGPSPAPSVANQTIQATYEYEYNYTPSGGPSSFYCLSATSTGTTGSAGQFSLALTIPSSSCVPRSCSTYTGPYTPTAFGVAAAAPAGYFVASTVSATTVTVDFVYALASTAMNPFGRTTVSLGAPVTLVGSAYAGNGAASPATLQYSWTLTGSGWSIVDGSGTAAFTVISSPSAAAGDVQLWVNGTYGGVVEHGMVQSATLNPVATQIVAQGVTPTSLDAGTPATFSITGSGSAGYNYTATVFPSLGQAAVSAPCAATSAPGGTVSLSCGVSVTYPTPGTANPTGSLTNQYSAATTAFAQLNVAPSIVVTVSPQPAAAYVASPVTLTVSVTSGGTGPYGPACYWPGDGAPFDCLAGGATRWTFQHAFSHPGRFPGYVTVTDAAGTNRSFPATVEAWARPNLTTIAPASSNGAANTPILIPSVYSGGALPAVYWWNDSLPSVGTTTLGAGTLERDGWLNFTFVGRSAGEHAVSLSVVDGLGTHELGSWSFLITPGPARSVIDVGPPGPWSVAAGSPYNVSWAAVDPSGQAVPAPTPVVTLVPGPGFRAGSVWVNSSKHVPLLPDAVGDFDLAALSSGGYFNFSIASTHAGPITFTVAGNLSVADAPHGQLTLEVLTDSQHPRLTQPRVVVSTSGTNCTLWTITDRYLNPMRDGWIVVRTEVGDTTSTGDSRVLWDGQAGHVWVNYSFPAGVGGTVFVLSASDQQLLVPIVIPGTTPIQPIELIAVLGLAGLAAGCIGIGARSRRPGLAPTPTASEPSASTDGELQRLAEGRAHVLSRADPAVPRSLDELAAGWNGPPPDPAEMTEWVSSLVAEGQLRSIVGQDGKPRFLLLPGGVPGPPKVEIDPRLFERVLANRPEPESPVDGSLPEEDRREDSTDPS